MMQNSHKSMVKRMVTRGNAFFKGTADAKRPK